MKIYEGICDGFRVFVISDDPSFATHELSPRLDVRNHSPTGFAWGYGGSGPAQLALALSCDALADIERATAIYQVLAVALIGRMQQDDDFTISDTALRALIAMLEHKSSAI